jgi:DNA-binding MarR family transcriptional regulator
VSSAVLSADDIELLGDAVALAARQWRATVAAVSDKYSLGPRGVRILGLIDSGRAAAHSDLVAIFQCAPSLVSIEVSKLRAAGLIDSQQSDLDGRQFDLSLTPLGKETIDFVGKKLAKMGRERLAQYSRKDILLCAGILQRLARSDRYSF